MANLVHITIGEKKLKDSLVILSPHGNSCKYSVTKLENDHDVTKDILPQHIFAQEVITSDNTFPCNTAEFLYHTED